MRDPHQRLRDIGDAIEIRHAVNFTTQLQIVIPRGVEAQPDTAPGAKLIDNAEDPEVEIEAADYETGVSSKGYPTKSDVSHQSVIPLRA